MTHEDEYHDNMVTMLELIWGEGYMAPGGPGNVAKMLDGFDTYGKRILEIGCGICGPAFEMARCGRATAAVAAWPRPNQIDRVAIAGEMLLARLAGPATAA